MNYCHNSHGSQADHIKAQTPSISISFFSNNMEPKSSTWPLASILILVLIGSAASDIAQDKEKCTNQLIGLGSCLPYVAGAATTPPGECCTGLNQVMAESKECVCILIKDRNEPSLGLNINATLALVLPLKCHSPNPNLSECPAILHLPANSTDAKVFQEFARNVQGNNDTSNSTSLDARGVGGGRSTFRANGAGSTSTSTATSTGKGQSRYQFHALWLLALLFTSIIYV